MYLSVRLRKKAWNTTSKRFSRVLEIVNVLPYLLPPTIVFGEIGYSGSRVFLSPIVYLLYLVSTFCITISATALMLQVMFPWLSEKNKRCLQSNAVTKCKLILEITTVIMIVVYNICWIILNFPFDFIDFIPYIFSALLYFFGLTSFILQIFSIICMLLFGCKTARLRTSTKILRIKLFLLATIVVLDSIISAAFFIVILTTCILNGNCTSPVFGSIANSVCIQCRARREYIFEFFSF